MWTYNEETQTYESEKAATQWCAKKLPTGHFEYWIKDQPSDRAVISRSERQTDEQVLAVIYRVMNTEIFDI